MVSPRASRAAAGTHRSCVAAPGEREWHCHFGKLAGHSRLGHLLRCPRGRCSAPHGTGPRRISGALEGEIPDAPWATGLSPPGELRTRIGGGLACNTVHTTPTRLWGKGLVARDVDGRRGAYRPVRTGAEPSSAPAARASAGCPVGVMFRPVA
ncbi:BlaI/MecI/CopY family transcriptional regulator [Streptomyces sp. NPDC002055]|uniref:BlaI/MecI/CopY family transcriptional regulator n=1 Tax=Streptomyces sp. NPDC002055 TaxID=3154534 RepID=UPI0033174C33